MFQPRIPVNPTPTAQVVPVVTPTAIEHHPGASAPCGCSHHIPAPAAPEPSRPAVQLTPGGVVAVAGAGVAVVLVVGAVLVSMLLAVAITGASLAICALVIRSLITTDAKRR
ncbi:SpdD-like protein [Streptomyces sp. NBC_00286]|uniref:SpdD-like protein n=1 Tax=Streptomyces sp. NBC_00286 TaxID=2975701 RepID=UPI002E2D4811|nr:SpdD-like protein [Streptomyces sp. NBC_00286]